MRVRSVRRASASSSCAMASLLRRGSVVGAGQASVRPGSDLGRTPTLSCPAALRYLAATRTARPTRGRAGRRAYGSVAAQLAVGHAVRPGGVGTQPLDLVLLVG